MKTKQPLSVILGLTTLLFSVPALAQGPTTATGASPTQVLTQAVCQNDVAKFEQSVTLVRQTLGAKAANDLREKLLPSREIDEVGAQEGPCGVARLLRSKKLI